MVEFLLVLLPMLSIATSTVGLTWYAFERVSLRVLGMQAAWQLSEPDFDQADLQEFIAGRLKNELGMSRFSLDAVRLGKRSSVSLLVDQMSLPGGLGLMVPEQRVSSNASFAD